MTRIDLRIQKTNRKSRCLAAGFVALDIIEGQSGAFAAAGGSCGNVSAILAWMGWEVAPATRLGADAAGAFVQRDLQEAGALTDHLIEDGSVQSPIVIQRFIENAAGGRTHRFSLTCPECGGWLPRYRSLTLRHADAIVSAGSAPKVFYFDRASPGILKLATWARQEGAIVVFEPPSVSEERNFQRAVDLCHVLKYANDRLGHVPDLAKAKSPRIVVETLGEDGLRVRWRSRWSHLPAFEAPRFIDAAGSGDWCTAGLIHVIGQTGAAGLAELNKALLDAGLRFGQALAAVNCGFEGARGAMMALTHRQMNKALGVLTNKTASVTFDWDELDQPAPVVPRGLCDICMNSKVGSQTARKRTSTA